MEGYVYRVTTAMVQYNPNFWVTPGELPYNPLFPGMRFPHGGEWVSDYYGEAV